MSRLGKDQLPPLMKISVVEASSIAAAFRLYDYKATGKIPRHLAKRLTKSLGYDVPVGNMSNEITVRELLIFLDGYTPEPDPKINNQLHFFSALAAHKDEFGNNKIIPKDINDFMVSLGKPSISLSEAEYLLISMLDYDDCSDVPAVDADHFSRDVILFAKKNNVLKDFRG